MRSLVGLGLIIFLVAIGCAQPTGSPEQDAVAGQIAQAQIVTTADDLPPPSPENEGHLYFVTEEALFYFSDGTEYVPIDLSGPAGEDGAGIVWKGALSSPPENPELNWAYYDSTSGAAYIWDGDSWEILAQDGSDVPDLSATGVIDPGDFLTLEHNLGRDDVTFDAQFVKSSFIYDYSDYQEYFSSQFAELTATTEFESSRVDSATAAGLSNGNLVIAYPGPGTDNGGRFQVYRADGTQVVSPQLFDSRDVNSEIVAALANGSFAIAYTYQESVFGPRYGAQVVCDVDGNLTSGPTPVSASEISSLAMTTLANNTIVTAFEDHGNEGKLTYVVHDTDGNVVVTPKVIESASTGNVWLSPFSNGDFVMTYRDWDNPAGEFAVISSTGSVVVAPRTFQSGSVQDIRSATFASDRFVISYDRMDQTEFRIFAQDGTELAGPRMLERDNTSSTRIVPVGQEFFAISYFVSGDIQSETFTVYNRSGEVVHSRELVPDVYDLARLPHGRVALVHVDSNASNDVSAFLVKGSAFLALERLNHNEVRLWNRTTETLELMLSVNR